MSYLVFDFNSHSVALLSEDRALKSGISTEKRWNKDAAEDSSVAALSVRLSPLTRSSAVSAAGRGWAAVDTAGKDPGVWMYDVQIVSLLACEPDPAAQWSMQQYLAQAADYRLTPVANLNSWLNRLTNDPQAAKKLHERTAAHFAVFRPRVTPDCLVLDPQCGIRSLSFHEVKTTTAFRRQGAGVSDVWCPRSSFSLARACDWVARAQSCTPPFGSAVIAGLTKNQVFPAERLLSALREEAPSIALAASRYQTLSRQKKTGDLSLQ